jgi:hypothetical protein
MLLPKIETEARSVKGFFLNQGLFLPSFLNYLTSPIVLFLGPEISGTPRKFQTLPSLAGAWAPILVLLGGFQYRNFTQVPFSVCSHFQICYIARLPSDHVREQGSEIVSVNVFLTNAKLSVRQSNESVIISSFKSFCRIRNVQIVDESV